MKMTLSKSLLIILSVLGVVACTSVNNDSVSDTIDDEYISQTNAAVYLCGREQLDVLFHAEKAEVVWKGKKFGLEHITKSNHNVYEGEGASLLIEGEKAMFTFSASKDSSASKESISCKLFRLDS